MRTPIAHRAGLSRAHRIRRGQPGLFRAGQLGFEPPDLQRFPCLALAYQALQAGGSAAVVLNAANEVAVESFLRGELAFDRIPALLEEVLARAGDHPVGTLEEILHADRRRPRSARACSWDRPAPRSNIRRD